MKMVAAAAKVVEVAAVEVVVVNQRKNEFLPCAGVLAYKMANTRLTTTNTKILSSGAYNGLIQTAVYGRLLFSSHLLRLTQENSLICQTMLPVLCKYLPRRFPRYTIYNLSIPQQVVYQMYSTASSLTTLLTLPPVCTISYILHPGRPLDI